MLILDSAKAREYLRTHREHESLFDGLREYYLNRMRRVSGMEEWFG
jgi:hypothetical protein